jgi:hypothetical protein
VVVLVSCMPVVTLGFGAALTHLLRDAPAGDPALHPGALPDGPGVTAEVIPAPAREVHAEGALEAHPHPALEAAPPASRERTRRRSAVIPGKQLGPVTPERLAGFYGADLAAGRVPSARQIKREWPVGSDRAAELHDHLEATLTPP